MSTTNNQGSVSDDLDIQLHSLSWSSVLHPTGPLMQDSVRTVLQVPIPTLGGKPHHSMRHVTNHMRCCTKPESKTAGPAHSPW